MRKENQRVLRWGGNERKESQKRMSECQDGDKERRKIQKGMRKEPYENERML